MEKCIWKVYQNCRRTLESDEKSVEAALLGGKGIRFGKENRI